MMRSPWMPFVLAAAVSVLIGVGVAMEPYFGGDVRVTRIVQSASPGPEWWARPVSNLALVTVFGNPSGFTFPSTTITFFSVTFGTVGLVAAIRRNAPNRVPVMIAMFGMLVLGCLARVALGAHWPSDVVLTSVICLVWIWAAARGVLP